MWILILAIIISGGIMASKYISYRNSGYGYSSGNGFIRTLIDKGNYGEFLTYKYLEKLRGHNQIMTNLYLPKNDGTTTEVDLIMISETGIYVFESKNYGGWIFGDEKNKKWTQSLHKGSRFKFFNPIWQNGCHITALKESFRMDDDSLFKSYVIFSERCTLKKITVRSESVKVMKRDQLLKIIKKDIKESKKKLSENEINELYSKLLKFTLAEEDMKKKHILNLLLNKH